MNIITFKVTEIIEKITIVDLPNDTLNWKRVVIFGGIFSLCGVVLFFFLSLLGVEVLYGEIAVISLLVVAFFGLILGGYGLLNTLYQRPILILTTSNIYLGLKVLFRPAIVTDRGILPKDDLQLIVVKDSRSHRYRLFLEGRKLLQLGVYNSIIEAESQRMHLKKLLSAFYHQIYISSPTYHEI
ncbi:MAG: hypothetical protein JSU57_01305 [Candidatus Heimdallarchaeota archaeon]|nr:MAG: hypothetical protein JSU57_01305 [Candidatus Heimdallarchaeota archaeon]